MRMVVVLPAPFGPMKPNRSPRFRFKSIDLIANSSPYFFVRSRVSIMKVLVAFPAAGQAHEAGGSLAPSRVPGVGRICGFHRQDETVSYRYLGVFVIDPTVFA